MVICEEKYSFTPDDLKAATREQRKSKTTTVEHLNTGSDIINDNVFNKDAATKTVNGKRAISTYMTSNLQSLSSFPFGFEGRIWDLIVSVPDHCLSFYFHLRQ